MPLPIETERLILRAVTADDAEALFCVFGDPEVMRYIGSGATHANVERTRQILEKCIDHQQEHGFSLWAMVVKADGQVVGDCGLQYLEGGPEVEVGYRLACSAWGHGYATEGATAAVRFAFDELGLDRIVAIAQPANLASQRVMQKIGMRHIGQANHYNTLVERYEIQRP